MTTTKTMTATDLNKTVLFDHMNGAARAPNRLHAVDAPHIRRCFKAGLVTVEGTELVLTAAGLALQPAYEAKKMKNRIERLRIEIRQDEEALAGTFLSPQGVDNVKAHLSKCVAELAALTK